ncbi:MAG: serine/threonine protein kinase [Myxococcota bacterium]|nr:serine/threonine protein kinase [Deltaproteobacteria bacterium]MDQ3333831.1 serine/threonine protein kinase [Myxococcota bacterium]
MSTRGAPAATAIGTGLVQRAAAPTSVGQYRIERTLGSGGFGVVYAAKHDMLGKPVAIKMLRHELVADTQQSQRFLREARIAAGLSHENIVDITDFGTDEKSGAPYLVMELLRGRTLSSLCAMGPLPWARAVNILLQLARALVCAHADGVLHRDLKPHNIMLESSSGRVDLVKLCDFGVSRVLDGGDRITNTGTFVGTPAYMAPEQINGDTQDARTDLYAFGVTAYEMLTGHLPYRSTSGVALVSEILGGTRSALAFPPDVPEPLARLVARCLAHDPALRPSGALELEGELLAISALPSEPMPANLVGETIGNVRVIEQIGSGGSGAVWLAEHPVIGTKFAIKVLRPEVATMPGAFERFINEARAASSIKSPFITRYIDLGRLPGGQPYAVMEYLEGETLHGLLDRRLRLDVTMTIRIARQIASALVQAHDANIIHRDIKPANVFLVGEDRQVKILDFGIAKLGGPQATSSPKTQAGFFMGTVPYCPPEQLLGLEIGPKADVYALGVTMFEMLSGSPPFSGDAMEIAAQVTSREAPTLASSNVPRLLSMLVDEMLVRDPRGRPSMDDVLERLDSITEERTVPPHRAPIRRRTWVAGAAIGVVMAVLLAWKLWPDAVASKPAKLLAPASIEHVEMHASGANTLEPPPVATAKKPTRVRPSADIDIIIADPFKK